MFRAQHPERLATLVRGVRIESVEASNRIEGIRAPHHRIRDLVDLATTPGNRSEQEIAGYRSDSAVEELLADGTRRVRFVPVQAWRTADALRDLNEGYLAAADDARYHPLLLVGCYVLDLLVIHPFSDGNGRLSRLLTLLLLLRAGYHVGRYVSLERLIDESRDSYHDALAESTAGWDTGDHDPQRWLRYFVGVVMLGVYDAFATRAAGLGGRGSKTAALHAFLETSISDTFTIADLRNAAPTASDALIKKATRAWREQGLIGPASRGRGGAYRRLDRDEPGKRSAPPNV